MREAAFVKKNKEKWQQFEKLLTSAERNDPDKVSNLYIQITDDLAYARTFYPQSQTTSYLNHLAMKVHQSIYKNKKVKSNRFVSFWMYELPLLFWESRKQFLYSFLIFMAAVLIGALSSAYDENFPRLILGDYYVNMTIENINKNDPMAVYKSQVQLDMFFGITFNNVRVSFLVFVLGIFFSIGSGYLLFTNGIMLGSFQYFFYKYGLLFESVLSIWIHGTIEISSIIIAGGSGMVLGNSLLFPGTYPRMYALKQGAKRGVKIIVGLVPLFIIAGFLEGFVTRLTESPTIVKLGIILISAAFVIYYFVFYPQQLAKKVTDFNNE
ncbi:stage II sporulation protein M [Chondrinema litorale]|uniref:stage II sporulation protein M n=1 Tax=Chondrinema litorale TaxID=2994555 RepID=UPI002543D168|nr:stage II sporulation protein M [Chondrinema litorale]UZR94273.1 stage II sporulation protein M [Chondrinema litorale]